MRYTTYTTDKQVQTNKYKQMNKSIDQNLDKRLSDISYHLKRIADALEEIEDNYVSINDNGYD